MSSTRRQLLQAIIAAPVLVRATASQGLAPVASLLCAECGVPGCPYAGLNGAYLTRPDMPPGWDTYDDQDLALMARVDPDGWNI